MDTQPIKVPGSDNVDLKKFGKRGCGCLFVVWLVCSCILTIAQFSVLPIAADAVDAEGPWVTVALVFNFLLAGGLSLFVVGLFMAVGLGFIAVGLFLYAMLTKKDEDDVLDKELHPLV